MACKFKSQKKRRQKEAKERDLARSKRTIEQQLCLIKTRRGESKKERARLELLLAEQKLQKEQEQQKKEKKGQK